MITLALTNRNRDLNIVRNCLQSLYYQENESFNCFLVDYGSELNYLKELRDLLLQFPKINFISCPVSGQLWNKSRAINIVLNQTTSSHFLVGDIDMLFSPDFFQRINQIKNAEEVIYFKVGFLSKKESLKNVSFKEYQESFCSDAGATGITLFPTLKLKDLNGYDEFYHGWGAEDTDVHLRMKNAGITVSFYDQEILVKHQWHPKAYRSKESQHPFQSQLERINHNYMYQSNYSKRTIANNKLDFGKETQFSEYEKLNQKPDFNIIINNSQIALEAMLSQMAMFLNETVEFKITPVTFSTRLKNRIKRFLGKKYMPYFSMEDINNRLLLEIINRYRNNPYKYNFDRQEQSITLIIRL